MSPRDRMSPVELRASVSLALIFGLRLFGMFVITPVFAIYAEQLPGGSDLTLVGIAIGIVMWIYTKPLTKLMGGVR